MNTVVAFPLPSKYVAGDTILRLSSVKERVGLGRTSIYAAVKNGTFPTSVKLGGRAVGWLASSIDAWIESRVQDGRQQVSA